MIKLEKTEVVGWEHAIRGMRNPMNSWGNSDSQCLYHMAENWERGEDPELDKKYDDLLDIWGLNLQIGPNDHDLMMRLAKGGPVHAKYRRMIVVYVDIIAPLYWWKEFDTYKVGTVANSCSTMHKIHEKEFTLEDFSTDHLSQQSLDVLEDILITLNQYRVLYVSKDDKRINMYTEMSDECYAKYKKDLWWQMIQLLPSSYNQTRNVMMNYEVLANIYKSRKDHKLDEWREFCQWIETLPYSELITGGEIGNEN